jgi:hypothetical protein
MKNSMAVCLIGSLVAGNMCFAQAQNAPGTPKHTHHSSLRSWIKILQLSCETAGLETQDSAKSQHHRLTLGAPIKLKNGDLIEVYYLEGAPDNNNLVGIIEKGPETDEETPHIKRVCLNKKDNSPTPNEGDIVFPTKLGQKANIRFHLNKLAGDEGHLELNSWMFKAANSLAMTGPFKGDKPVISKPTQPGTYPPCVKGIAVSGAKREDLSFDFSECLASSTETVTYVYNLYLRRHRGDGNFENFKIDPQIINHGQNLN